MANCTLLKRGCHRDARFTGTKRCLVRRPECKSEVEELVGTRRVLDRFQEQMAEKESEIERRIAEVAGLEIHEHQSRLYAVAIGLVRNEQNVLRAEVSQHETHRRHQCFIDQPVEWRTQVGMSLCDEAVEGIE